MSAPPPAGQAPDIRRALLRILARSYKLGPAADGSARWAWADGTPLDPAWPEAEGVAWDPGAYFTAACYLMNVLGALCFEIDAVQAEGRAVDVAGFLDGREMLLTLHEGGPALLARLTELGYLPAGQAAPATSPAASGGPQ